MLARRCADVRVCADVHVCTDVRVYVRMCVCADVCRFTCVLLRADMRAHCMCVRVLMYVCASVR